VKVKARWTENRTEQEIDGDELDGLWDEIEAGAESAIVLVLRASGAEITAAIGDASGTSLVYYPPGYEEKATGSLHSVGDAAAAERDDWKPPLTAYCFGHHTEFPRWSVVSHSAGRQALTEFCERPETPPSAVAWEPD